MEPPKAITKDDKEKNYKKTSKITSFKIYEQESKEKYYLIELWIKEENMVIVLKNYESPIPLTYEGEFSFLNLIKINKYFRMFETLDEIIQNIVELQSKGLISISKNLNDNFDFILNVELNKEKIQIKFELLFIDNNQLSQLSNLLILFEKKCTAYELENKELKKYLLDLKLKLDKNEEEFSLFKNLHKMNSSIIFEIDELTLLMNQIEKNMNQKVNYFKQLYKGTRDGEGMDNIKIRAFNINNILLLVRSKSGFRFGGFTSICFEEISGSDRYKSDDKSFVFSLDRKETYAIIKKEQAMRLSAGRAFMFGPNDIWVYGNFLSGKNGNKLGGYTGQDTYDYKGLNAALSGVNKQYFELQEVEAYQVIYL